VSCDACCVVWCVRLVCGVWCVVWCVVCGVMGGGGGGGVVCVCVLYALCAVLTAKGRGQIFLDMGANLQERGVAPLLNAIKWDHVPLIELLLSKGARVEYPSSNSFYLQPLQVWCTDQPPSAVTRCLLTRPPPHGLVAGGRVVRLRQGRVMPDRPRGSPHCARSDTLAVAVPHRPNASVPGCAGGTPVDRHSALCPLRRRKRVPDASLDYLVEAASHTHTTHHTHHTRQTTPDTHATAVWRCFGQRR
jgi:hypothetical protein